MGTVHLRVVELERYGQCCFEPSSAVFTPYHERVVEDSAVHSYCAVDVELRQCGGPDDHTVR